MATSDSIVSRDPRSLLHVSISFAVRAGSFNLCELLAHTLSHVPILHRIMQKTLRISTFCSRFDCYSAPRSRVSNSNLGKAFSLCCLAGSQSRAASKSIAASSAPLPPAERTVACVAPSRI